MKIKMLLLLACLIISYRSSISFSIAEVSNVHDEVSFVLEKVLGRIQRRLLVVLVLAAHVHLTMTHVLKAIFQSETTESALILS